MTRRLRLSDGAWSKILGAVDPDTSQLTLRTRLAYRLTGIANSILFQMQIASLSENLATVSLPTPPIFVLGFWRSGTTLLHEFLCCDPQFGFPTTYACMNPSHFVLSEGWASRRLKHTSALRPMDNMSYSWSSPQEDEFALLALGAYSPYRALIAPSLMRDPRRLLDFSQYPWEEQERWSSTFQLFLQLLTVQQGKTIVLKSPPHGFRLTRLFSMFPKAKFVVIERNPYEVFASNLKLWRSLLHMYSVESFTSEEIEGFVLAAFSLHESAIANARQSGRLVFVSYESLIADPLSELERLYVEMGLGKFEKTRQLFQQYATRVVNHTRNRFSISSVQKLRVEEHWGTYISERRYRWPDRHLELTG